MIFLNAILASTLVLAAPTALPTRTNVATKAAALAKVSTLAKINGPITTVGTSSIAVNGITVNIASNTILLRRFGGKSSLKEFSATDQVQVVGKWADEGKTKIDARMVRDLSIQKRYGSFVGTLQTLSSNGFTFQPFNRQVQTVTIGATTRYADRTNRPITFSSLALGHRLLVRGMWDSKLNTITEVNLIRDYSLPTAPENKIATTSGKVKTQDIQTRTPTTLPTR